MKSARCSSCGANITIDERTGKGICEYCNTSYVEETKNSNINENTKTKFCKYCGNKISEHAIICVHCGSQVEELKRTQPQNTPVSQQPQPNQYYNVNNYYNQKPPLDKWVAFLLCFFLGCFGAHKFYEGKYGMGILYLCTMGLFGIGWLIDIIVLLTKPNKYYS